MPRKRSPPEKAVITYFWKTACDWTGGTRGDLDEQRAWRLTRLLLASYEELDPEAIEDRAQGLDDMLAAFVCVMDEQEAKEACEAIVHDSWAKNEVYEEPEGTKAMCRGCKHGGDYMQEFFDRENKRGATCPRCGGHKINVGEDVPF